MGQAGSCDLSGLYLTAEGQHVDNLIGIDHAKPSTSSQLNYKGILDGKSRAVFGGQILVRKDAQKVNLPAGRQEPAAFRPGRNRQQAPAS